jgi:hypothetical protein
VINIPVGATNVPVLSVNGFKVGEKIALGHGATFPAVAKEVEQYEVATITEIGKPGTQAYLGVNVPAGATNIKVTNVANITAGDKIRLDIDSVGYGIETVTVTKVGTPAIRLTLAVDAPAGATNIKTGRGWWGGNTDSRIQFTVGDKMTIGTPATQETVTITSVGTSGVNGTGVDFTPALAASHKAHEDVVAHGTGLDLAAPLKFKHAANMPFSARGTGITFTPATAFAHISNEPVQPLGTGITLDKPLSKAHAIEAVVRDAAVKAAGYQGTPVPNQWFGGPALSTSAGNMVLRNAAGLVVDSLNYGLVVDPWASEGYHGVSGAEQGGCRVPSPTAGRSFPGAPVDPSTKSAGRITDGLDTDSNCNDFETQAATTLAAASAVSGNNIKVASVTGFEAGQPIMIDTGANMEKAVIATVGTPGATAVTTATTAGATALPVGNVRAFTVGQTIAIDSGANQETAVVASVPWRGGAITLAKPLTLAHAVGAQVSGTGITLTDALTREHASGAQVYDNVPTPGAPNRYFRKSH